MTSESHKSENEKALKVIKLSTPYTFGEKKISECRILREPLAKDLKGIQLAKGLADDQFILLGRISNLSTTEIENMTMGDVMLCMKTLEDFLPESLRT
jgi:hypothetical protein